MWKGLWLLLLLITVITISLRLFCFFVLGNVCTISGSRRSSSSSYFRYCYFSQSYYDFSVCATVFVMTRTEQCK